jgi:hypothetical protein
MDFMVTVWKSLMRKRKRGEEVEEEQVSNLTCITDSRLWESIEGLPIGENTG